MFAYGEGLKHERNGFVNGHKKTASVRMGDGQFAGSADLFLKNRNDAAVGAEDVSEHLGKDIRTAQRYEAEGLPVYRRQHAKHGSVYAYKSELDRWWTAREKSIRHERAEFTLAPRLLRARRYLRPAIYVAVGIAISSSAFLARQLLFGAKQALASSSSLHSTVAVLPFSDASPASSDDSLAQDFTERVVMNLKLEHSLRLLEISGVDQPSGRPPALSYIVNTLHADVFLSGTIARDRNELRINAQLANARSGKTLWKTQFENDAADVNAFESRVAHAVAIEVENALSVEGK